MNKIATLRDARGGNVPDVQKFAIDCEALGADGITVHPRPDERHIRRSDVFALRPLVKTEFNMEEYPSGYFIDLVLKAKPEQVTLVPDGPDAITSSDGWIVEPNKDFLTSVVETFKEAGIRTSIFVGTDLDNIKAAAETGADRVELYTEPFAIEYPKDPEAAVAPFVEAAIEAHRCGLGLNAGHDLSLENIKFFAERVPYLNEVSIGYCIGADPLYMGFGNTIKVSKESLVW